jgi:hypothetical protein
MSSRSVIIATALIRKIPVGGWAVVYGHKVYCVTDPSLTFTDSLMYRVPDAWGSILLRESQAAYACLFRRRKEDRS